MTLHGFAPDVGAALEELLAARHPKGTVATLDLDNTCVHNDTGEAVFYGLCRGGHLDLAALLAAEGLFAPFDRDPALPDPRPEIKACLEDGSRLPSCAKAVVRAYWALLRCRGKEPAYTFCSFLLCGLEVDRVLALSREILETELARPLASDRFEQRQGDPDPITVAAGLRVYEPIRELIGFLQAAGVEPWIVSASNCWTVQTFASRNLGIPAEHTIGIRPKVENGRVTAQPDPQTPITVGQGKVEAIQRFIGRQPVLAIGDSNTDFEMLCSSTRLAVVIDHGDETLRQRAAQRPARSKPRFLFQPQFSP